MITKLAIRLDQIEDALAEHGIAMRSTKAGDLRSVHMELGATELEILDEGHESLFVPEDMAEAVLYRVGGSTEVTESFDTVQNAEEFADTAYRLLTE